MAMGERRRWGAGVESEARGGETGWYARENLRIFLVSIPPVSITPHLIRFRVAAKSLSR